MWAAAKNDRVHLPPPPLKPFDLRPPPFLSSSPHPPLQVVLLASASFSTLSLVITHFSGQATEQRRAELALEARPLLPPWPQRGLAPPACARRGLPAADRSPPCCLPLVCLQLEREKARRAQLGELYDVTAQYRGPLLEAAIDLEQALWHLVRRGRCCRRLAVEPRGAVLAQGCLPGADSIPVPAARPTQITDAGLRQQPAEPLSADCADCDSNRSYVMFTIAQLLGFVEVSG